MERKWHKHNTFFFALKPVFCNMTDVSSFPLPQKKEMCISYFTCKFVPLRHRHFRIYYYSYMIVHTAPFTALRQCSHKKEELHILHCAYSVILELASFFCQLVGPFVIFCVFVCDQRKVLDSRISF